MCHNDPWESSFSTNSAVAPPMWTRDIQGDSNLKSPLCQTNGSIGEGVRLSDVWPVSRGLIIAELAGLLQR